MWHWFQCWVTQNPSKLVYDTGFSVESHRIQVNRYDTGFSSESHRIQMNRCVDTDFIMDSHRIQVHYPSGPVVTAGDTGITPCLPSTSRAADLGSIPAFSVGIFPRQIIPVTYKLALQCLPCQAPGMIGPALGLVGPVSAYSDWVRKKIWSATSLSLWQHVKLRSSVPEIH